MITSVSGSSDTFSPRVRESRFQHPGNFLLVESAIPLTIEIQNPSSADREPGIQCLESGFHGLESKIQDCLVFWIP